MVYQISFYDISNVTIPDSLISFLTSKSIQLPPLVVLTIDLFKVKPSTTGIIRVAWAPKSIIRLVGRPAYLK